MNRKELTDEIADLFGRSKISVSCLDRALATRGVREGTRRGRGAPDVSSTDIVNLAIGIASDRTLLGAADFAREVSRLQLCEILIARDGREITEPPDPYAPKRFGPEIVALIEQAPSTSDLIDMEVRVSLTSPEAQIRIASDGEVKTYLFHDPSNRPEELCFESYVTFPKGVLHRLIEMRHGSLEIPEARASENPKNLVGPAGFEPALNPL